MDFDVGKRNVSLGGARRNVKTRQEVLAAAKVQRQQRAVAVAPQRSTAALQRHFRGILQRRRTATLIRIALREAVASSVPTSAASIERRLALLWRCSSSAGRRGDVLLTEACCCLLIQSASAAAQGREASLAAPACVCRSAVPSFGTPDAWSRRTNRVLPALLCAAGSLSGGDAAAVCHMLCTSDRAWTECCRPRRADLGFQLLAGGAAVLFNAFASRLSPGVPPASTEEHGEARDLSVASEEL